MHPPVYSCFANQTSNLDQRCQTQLGPGPQSYTMTSHGPNRLTDPKRVPWLII